MYNQFQQYNDEDAQQCYFVHTYKDKLECDECHYCCLKLYGASSIKILIKYQIKSLFGFSVFIMLCYAMFVVLNCIVKLSILNCLIMNSNIVMIVKSLKL